MGLSHLLRLLRKHRALVLGGFLVLLVGLAAAFGPMIWQVDPMALEPTARLLAPCRSHPLGSDDMGRDVMSRMFYGARLSIMVGLGTVLACGFLGAVLGLAAGYFSSLDSLIMRILDGLMAFPALLLALALMAAWGASVLNLVLALGTVYVPSVARIVRGSVLTLREAGYVEAARAIGCSHARVVTKHIWPGCLAPLCVQLTFIFAQAILAEAALSFLGVGVPPYMPTWGNVIAEGRVHIYRAPWLTVFPGLAISTTVLGLNLLGDGLRDLVDPRIRAERGA